MPGDDESGYWEGFEDFYEVDEETGDLLVPLSDLCEKYNAMLREFFKSESLVYMVLDVLRYTHHEAKHFESVGETKNPSTRRRMLADNLLEALVCTYNLVLSDECNKGNSFYEYLPGMDIKGFVKNHYLEGSNDGLGDYVTSRIYYEDDNDDTEILFGDDYEPPSIDGLLDL